MKAWWEDFDYGLSEKEKEQVQALSREIVERAKIQNLLTVAKKLGDMINHKPTL